MTRNASPMQLFPVAQAVTALEFGPCIPYRMAIWPGARLMIVIGMKNGGIRFGPFSIRTLCHSSMA